VSDATLVQGAPALLELEAVTRTFGVGDRAVQAVGPVDLAVKRSEFIAIMGPSGSGKTTLLRLAGALDQPTEGRVRIGGEPLAKQSNSALAALRRRQIGYVFQDLNLLPGLTALENVSLPLELEGSEPLAACRAHAANELEQVGMAPFADRYPDDLSGGEQQRVAIARALVGSRDLLLADEPTGALDSVTGERILRLLRRQSDRGKSVVLVTHNSTHAAWADRVIYLRDGLIVDETP